MKKIKIALGAAIVVLGTAVCVTAKSSTWKKNQEGNHELEVTYVEDSSTYLSASDSGMAADEYLSDDPVSMEIPVGEEGNASAGQDGSAPVEAGSPGEEADVYPWESEWYGPYEEDGQSEKYHLWYDENGFQSHRLKEGYQELHYEGISCIEHTEDSETVLVYDGSYTPYAEQNVGEEKMAEFWERKAAGLPAYALQDEEGFVQEWRESDALEDGSVRGQLSGSYYLGFRWKMGAGMCYYGGNKMKRGTPVMYSTLQVHVQQSKKGKSYLVLKNRDTGEKVRILGSETEDGWDGTIKMGSIPEAYYSIGIENASGEEITYQGIYGYY